MKMLEILVRAVFEPFLQGYILIFGDDPERLSYVGLFFIIYCASIFILTMAFYEWLTDKTYMDLRIWNRMERWRRHRRMHQRAKNRLRKRRMEERLKIKIFKECVSEEYGHIVKKEGECDMKKRRSIPNRMTTNKKYNPNGGHNGK